MMTKSLHHLLGEAEESRLSMSSRSHLESFFKVRESVNRQRALDRLEDTDDEEIKLVHSNSISREPEWSPDPTWLSAVEQFRFECVRIGEKIDQLKERQESFVRTKTAALFDEEEVSLYQLEEQIKEKTNEIQRIFNRLHEIVIEIKNASTFRPKDKVLSNILQWQYREISQLTEKLRSCQREHIAKLTKKERYAEQFIINFDEIDIDSGSLVQFSSDNSATFHHDASLQSQVQIDLEGDNEYLRERDQEMSNVLKSIVDLNSIFQEMNALLVNQGSLLDRIDYNLESVQMKVEDGAIQLSRAEKSARRIRKWKCIMILCGSVILSLIIMALNH